MELLIVFIIVSVLLISIQLFPKPKSPKEFPESWENILNNEVAIYGTLDHSDKELFKSRVHEFIQTKPILGDQIEITDHLKLLVASSAVMLTLSFKSWNFNYLTGVTLVRGAVKDKNTQGLISGLMQSYGSKSQVVLSKSALVQGFKNIRDKKNVGVHEFAHVLDHADGQIDGVPELLMNSDIIEEWKPLMKRKIQEIQKRKSDINPYGGTNEVEFFAVIAEYFFEKPHILEKKHPQVYRLLEKTFQQNNSQKFKEKFNRLAAIVKVKISRNSKCLCGSGKKYKKCCMLKD